MDEQFDNLMERIRVRQCEMSDVKENDNENQNENATATVTATAMSKRIELKQEVIVPSSPTNVFKNSTKSNENETVQFRKPEDHSEQNSTINTTSSTNKKTSRFSMLAQELDDYEYDYQSQYNKPKEAYMKGRSPRLSVGENRPAVLCTPAGAASLKSPNIAKTPPATATSSKSDSAVSRISDFEARRIKFAQPMVNVNYLPNESSIFSAGSGSSSHDMSTVLGGSAEMMNVTTSSLSCDNISMMQQITHENTIINAQSCDNREAILKERQQAPTEEYGAHTFMRKKAPPKEPATTSEVPKLTKPTVHTLVSSPKPFSKEIGKSLFSPVHFTPKSTSSPKMTVESVLSPSKSAAMEASVAKTRRLQFEQQFQKTNISTNEAPIPTPRHLPTVAPVIIPHKKDLFAKKPEPQVVASTPIPVQTQWRGQANTPVVQGARAEDKTAGPELVGAGIGKLKNLKSRWEFSSATGTPIHPDATEDSLIATAIKMKETAVPNKAKPAYRSIHGRKGPSASSIHSQPSRSNTASPAAKNTRYTPGEFEDEVFEPVAAAGQQPETNTEINPIPDEYSGEDIASADTSRFIDHAFGFMEGTGAGTPSPYRPSLDGVAPLAKPEGSGYHSPRRLGRKEFEAEIIEEEDVLVGGGDTDEEEDVTEKGDIYHEGVEEEEEVEVEEEEPTVQEDVQESSSKANTSLAYSVSTYRLRARERMAETGTPLITVSPSAPVASLTSPQKLKKLIADRGDYDLPPSSGARVHESERDAKERLIKAMRVEEELISQSKRAMAFSREKPSFRGSREEFEAQWALLVHVEKHRALANEYERLKRDGPRIVEGPRGNVTVTQLTVKLARDYVAAHIASSKKPDELFYFVAVLRWGGQVDVSKMVTSDGALNRHGTLEFPVPLQLLSIPPDFRATVEIYGQRSMRDSSTHEDKFKLKGTTLKAKTRNTFLGGSGSSANTSAFQQSSSSAQCNSNFNLLGTFNFDINCPGKNAYNMMNTIYPLEGNIVMKVRKQPIDGADISFNGFLSMYQRTREGLGSWTRYWCVLDKGEMKFWKHPEDEGTKGWLVLLDLSTCCRPEGASTVNDVCPYPNSFHIDVWVPKEEQDASDRRGIEQLRVMLAADTQPDLLKWLSVINSTSKQLCTWRNPVVPMQ
uniref:PH domain-containing protein n=1 Tax=Caenorhabditis japonica TaxID=281687 RepID=A0A8R1I2Q9_CAEJA